MELNQIQSSALNWGEAASSLNQNFSKIGTDMEKMRYATTRNKGYFSSGDALKAAVENAVLGDIAYVESEVYTPYEIWEWASSGWVATGKAGGDETVNLGDYYNKEDVDTKFENHKVKMATDEVLGGIIAAEREDTDVTEVKIDPETGRLYTAGVTVEGEIIPDEEDLTVHVEEGKAVVRFRDRLPKKGKGYVIVREGDEWYKQMTQENTIYEIRYDFDLGGDTLEVPANCVLDFKGGGFSNGTILGSNTTIKAEKPFVIFDNVNIAGTFDVGCIYDKWFSYVKGDDNTAMFKNIIAMSNPDMENKIVIDRNTTYYVSASQNLERIISPTNNTELVINSNIQLMTNNFTHYGIIGLIGTENIRISGSGHIIGDVETHTGTSGEWGFGIEIRGAKNINISGITLEKCWGDGISTDEGSGIPENIIIDNIVCDNNRRQGISIVLGRNIVVKNSILQNTGQIKYTGPGCGIDVEPTYLDGSNPAENILIENCRLINNKGGAMTLTRYMRTTDNVTVSNCYGNGNLIISGVYNTTIVNCTFPNFSALGDNYNLNHINCNYYSGKHSNSENCFSYNNMVGCKFAMEDIGYSIVERVSEIPAGKAVKFYIPSFIGMIKITVVGTNRWIGQRAQEIIYTNPGGQWIRTGNRILGAETFDWANVRQLLMFPERLGVGDGAIYAKFFNENDYNSQYTFKIEFLGIPDYHIQYAVNIVHIVNRNEIPSHLSFAQYYDCPMYVGTVEIGYMRPFNGICIFDSGRGKPIWYHNGKWVDATGADVNASTSASEE